MQFQFLQQHWPSLVYSVFQYLYMTMLKKCSTVCNNDLESRVIIFSVLYSILPHQMLGRHINNRGPVLPDIATL